MATYAITTKRHQGTLNVPRTLLDRIERAMQAGWTGVLSRDEFARHCIEERLFALERLHADTVTANERIRSSGLSSKSESSR